MGYKTRKLNRSGFTMMESIMTMIILGVAMYMSLTFFDRLNVASKNEDIRIKTLALNTTVTEEIKSNFYNGTIYDEMKKVDKDSNGIFDLEEAVDIGITEEEFLIKFIKEKYTKSITPENSDTGPYYTTDVTVETIDLGINREFTEAEDKKAFLENIQRYDGASIVDVNKSDYVKYSSRFLSEIKLNETDENKVDMKLYDRICKVPNVSGYCADISAYKNIEDVINNIDMGSGNIQVVNSYYELTLPDVKGKGLKVIYKVNISEEPNDILLEYEYKNDLISSNNNSSIYKIIVKTVYEFKETKDSEMAMFITPQRTEMN